MRTFTVTEDYLRRVVFVAQHAHDDRLKEIEEKTLAILDEKADELTEAQLPRVLPGESPIEELADSAAVMAVIKAPNVAKAHEAGGELLQRIRGLRAELREARSETFATGAGGRLMAAPARSCRS